MNSLAIVEFSHNLEKIITRQLLYIYIVSRIKNYVKNDSNDIYLLFY